MEIKKIQRDDRPEKAKVSISFRITKTHSDFMRKHNISPTMLFREALNDLMEKENEW